MAKEKGISEDKTLLQDTHIKMHDIHLVKDLLEEEGEVKASVEIDFSGEMHGNRYRLTLQANVDLDDARAARASAECDSLISPKEEFTKMSRNNRLMYAINKYGKALYGQVCDATLKGIYDTLGIVYSDLFPEFESFRFGKE